MINRKAKAFIIDSTRVRRFVTPSYWLRAALGLTTWLGHEPKNRAKPRHRAECFLTGRSRGVSKRLSIARTKVKELSGEAKLFGSRKSSW